jgi:hypothetical protein
MPSGSQQPREGIRRSRSAHKNWKKKQKTKDSLIEQSRFSFVPPFVKLKQICDITKKPYIKAFEMSRKSFPLPNPSSSNSMKPPKETEGIVKALMFRHQAVLAGRTSPLLTPKKDTIIYYVCGLTHGL